MQVKELPNQLTKLQMRNSLQLALTAFNNVNDDELDNDSNNQKWYMRNTGWYGEHTPFMKQMAENETIYFDNAQNDAIGPLRDANDHIGHV